MLLRSALRRTGNAPRNAFTLLEILVVMAIIVMLADAGTYYAMQYLDDSKVKEAKLGVTKVSGAVQAYKVDYGSFPAELSVLTQQGEKGGPYLTENELLDPMKKPYQYDVGGAHQKPPGFKPDISTTINGKVVGNWD